MAAFTDMLTHPSRSLRQASRRFASPPPRSSMGAGTIGGLVLLVLTVVGIIWLWPEIQRYIRIERM